MILAVSNLQDIARPLPGIAYKLVSVLCFAAMAACVKQLGASVPVSQAIFFRGIVAMAILAALAWRSEGLHLLTTRNWRAHAARSLAGSLAMFCWFAALTIIPLAQVTAISFTVPLFLTVLAMVFLRERIHAYRWTALRIGFAGVFVIVAPDVASGGGNTFGVSISVLAAVLSAFALLFLRRMSGHEHALTITFYFFLTSTVLALVTALFVSWPAPTHTQWALLALTGLSGVLGQLFMSYAFRYAEASLVAPLDYVNMLFAILIGFYVFGEIPRLSTWMGAPLIIASGAIILWREYVRLKKIRSVQQIVP